MTETEVCSALAKTVKTGRPDFRPMAVNMKSAFRLQISDHGISYDTDLGQLCNCDSGL